MIDSWLLEHGKWLSLSSADKFYCLTSGHVELYVFSKGTSGQELRRHIGEISEGQWLYGIEGDKDFQIRALAIKDSYLALMDWDEAFSAPVFAENFDNFLKFFMIHEDLTKLPTMGEEATVGTCTLPKGKFLLSNRKTLLWGKVLEGSVVEKRILYRENIFLLWNEKITAREDLTVLFTTTDELIKTQPPYFFKRSVRLLINIFRRTSEALLQADEDRYTERLQERLRLKEAIDREIHSSINPFAYHQPVSFIADQDQPELVHVLRIIGDFLGLRKERISAAHNVSKEATVDEIIRQVSWKNELFGREVDLEDGWEKRDQGPLLVFLRGVPCAAIPKNSHTYTFINYRAHTSEPLSHALAEMLDKKAYFFYRAMPETVKDVKSWLLWTLSLCWSRDFFTLFCTSLIVGALPLVTPLVTQTVFSDIIPSYDKQAHLMVIQFMLVSLVAGAFTSLVRSLGVLRIKGKIHFISESALWLKFISLPTTFFRHYQIGDLTHRMQGINILSMQISSVLAGGIFSGIFSILTLLLMFWFSWKLALLVCAFWAIYIFISGWLASRSLSFERQKMEAEGKVSGLMLQLITGISRFKAASSEEKALYLWSKRFGEEWQWNKKVRWQAGWMEIVNQTQPIVLNFLLFWTTMTLFDNSLREKVSFLSQADFLSFNAALGSFGASMAGLMESSIALLSLLPHLERLSPILQESAETTATKIEAKPFSGNISLYDVNFRYREDLPYVLSDISLTIEAGSFVAIVGASGCGKSTLIRLLLGMDKPDKGIIQYDGQDLSQLDILSVRRQIGVVLQHGQLEANSIYRNIIGSLPLTIEDAWVAAEQAGIADDIKAMPMGMHTLISEGSNNISGGQKQRILIARAIVKKPRIFFFDEATSALDNMTQRIVSESLEKLRATVLVIAHRLSTIRNADKIIVLDRGRIAEIGTFSSLVQQNGLFAGLIKRQQLADE